VNYQIGLNNETSRLVQDFLSLFDWVAIASGRFRANPALFVVNL
jgi:hypothetical protein